MWKDDSGQDHGDDAFEPSAECIHLLLSIFGTATTTLHSPQSTSPSDYEGHSAALAARATELLLRDHAAAVRSDLLSHRNTSPSTPAHDLTPAQVDALAKAPPAFLKPGSSRLRCHG